MRACACLLIACLAPLPAALGQGEKKPSNILAEMQRREVQIKDREAKKAWTKIAWRSDPAAAIADATKEGKPLLVVLIVGERGRAKAERC